MGLVPFPVVTMVALTSSLSLAEFLECCPDDARYELVNGEMVKMEPIRAHKNVSRFLVKQFDHLSDRLNLDYVIDKDIVVRTVSEQGLEQGRKPDVTVVTAEIWNANVMTYGAIAEPPQLVVEVVSTNWDDDYLDQRAEYERLGIPEYWIVDYLAVASRAYLGNPKRPTVFVHHLQGDGTYHATPFREAEAIASPTFPDLQLTMVQILTASQLHRW